MKLKPAAHLLLSITLYATAAQMWRARSLRAKSERESKEARQTKLRMRTSFRAALEVWSICNAPLLSQSHAEA